MNRNYQKELEHIISKNTKEGVIPSLLLHSCCAPCSSYCLEYLSEYFHITVFYYNPNIFPKEEYEKRKEEQIALIQKLPAKYAIQVIDADYDPQRFFNVTCGLEQEKEGGVRCKKCFELRLTESALMAKKLGLDYVTTTLSISPLKDAELLNTVGEAAAAVFGITYLPSDFKKKNGYQRSITLSAEYGLYRQNYCGCIFSKPKDSVLNLI